MSTKTEKKHQRKSVNGQDDDAERNLKKKRNETNQIHATENKPKISTSSSSRKSQDKNGHHISTDKIDKRLINTQTTIRKLTKTDSKQHISTPTSKRILKQEFFPSKMDYKAVLNHLKKSEEVISSSSDRSLNEKIKKNENAKSKTSIKKKQDNSARKFGSNNLKDLKKPKKTNSFIGKSERKENAQIGNSKEYQPGNSSRKLNSESRKVASNDPQHSEQKIENKDDHSTSDSTSITKRPLTSTLKRGSVLNKNIPVVEVAQVSEKNDVDEKNDLYEYEDDFDSYESDFENYNSSDSIVSSSSKVYTSEGDSPSNEESVSKEVLIGPMSIDKDLERKLDSGNFDLNESNSRMRNFVQIQEIIEQDNEKLKENIKSNMTSLSDEGFEESKSLQFLNFAEAKKKHKHKKHLQMRAKRGEELLSMIKLDFMNFTLFQLLPVPYDEYIKRFGNSNCVQISIQTGERNMHEETQTESIQTVNKWTQMPPYITRENPLNLNKFRFENIGVGPDNYLDMDIAEVDVVSQYKLDQFLSNTLPLVFNVLLESKSQENKIAESSSNDNRFSEYLHRYQLPSEFVGKRKISIISINPKNPSFFLSVQTDDLHEDNGISLIYYWNINEDVPMCYFTCYGKISSCCFGPDPDTVLAGLENGILAVWNRKSSTSRMCAMVEEDVALKTPIQLSDINESHCSKVIAIQSLSTNQVDILDPEIGQINHQVCSLDSEGAIILWNIDLKKIERIMQNNKIFWGTKILYKNFIILLREVAIDIGDFECTKMTILNSKPASCLITATSGRIFNCRLTQEKINFRTYKIDNSTTPTCLCSCPFSNKYFLVGDDGGQITLFSEETFKPLMVILNKECENFGLPILYIQWSEEKPCNFFTINSNNSLDIWDMRKSIVSPSETVSLAKEVICVELSTIKSTCNMYFMITATKNIIYLHVLSSNLRTSNSIEFKEEMQTLMNYLKRL